MGIGDWELAHTPRGYNDRNMSSTSSRGVSHDRSEETPEAKARWFQSLTLAERMDIFCSITDLALAANQRLPHERHAQSTSGRLRVLEST